MGRPMRRAAVLALKAEEELAANPTAQVTDLHSVDA